MKFLDFTCSLCLFTLAPRKNRRIGYNFNYLVKLAMQDLEIFFWWLQIFTNKNTEKWMADRICWYTVPWNLKWYDESSNQTQLLNPCWILNGLHFICISNFLPHTNYSIFTAHTLSRIYGCVILLFCSCTFFFY